MNTFGFVADIKTFFDVQLSIVENSKFIFCVVVIFIIVFFIYIKNNIPSFKEFDNDKLALFLYIMPVCLIVNFFGNAGYKFVFNFLLVYLIQLQVQTRVNQRLLKTSELVVLQLTWQI